MLEKDWLDRQKLVYDGLVRRLIGRGLQQVQDSRSYSFHQYQNRLVHLSLRSEVYAADATHQLDQLTPLELCSHDYRPKCMEGSSASWWKRGVTIQMFAGSYTAPPPWIGLT